MSLQFPHGNVEPDQIDVVNRPSFLVDHRSFSTEVVAVCDYLALAIAGSFVLAALHPGQGSPWTANLSMLAISMLVFMLCARMFRSHAEGALKALPGHILRTLAALCASLVVTFGLLSALADPGHVTLPMLGWWFLAAAWLIVSWRCLVLWFAGKRSFRPLLAKRTVVIGSAPFLREMSAYFGGRTDTGYDLVGTFDTASEVDRDSATPYIGGMGNLRHWCVRHRIRTVLIENAPANPAASERILTLIDGLAADVRLLGRASIPEKPEQALISRFGGWVAVQVRDKPVRNWDELSKRTLDILGSGALILTLLPLFGLIAAAISLESPGGVLFRQRRFGFQNEEISVLKFRSMYVHKQDVSGAQRTTRGDPRVTRVGRILRRTSLDEIPQLFNVFMGTMSLVGPRPHATAMKVGDQLYHEAVAHYAQRHRVKPGITGLAQINGFRGEVDSMEHAQGRLDNDLRYLGSWSLALDIKILLRTVGCVFGDRNAY
jgi:Undecaprenyl-phosphate glucose phosphotransferase